MLYEDKAKTFGFVPMNHDKPNWFTVQTEPVYTDKGIQIPGYNRLYRTDTNDSLCIHSDSYRPVNDEDVFSAFEQSLYNAGNIDTTGMYVQRDRSHDGARMFSQYVLPAHTTMVGTAEISLQILMWNTHDGSRAASGKAGFFNWVCANTAVSGQTLNVFNVRHIGDVQAKVEVKLANLVKGIDHALFELEQIKQYRTITLNNYGATEIIKALPQVTERLENDLFANWARAKEDIGPNGGENLWCLHNVLTDWASHGTVKSNRANTVIERHERVAKLVNSKAWPVQFKQAA